MTTATPTRRSDAERARRRDWKRNCVRQQAYGTWQPYVDAEPVRQHVQTLRAAGLGRDRIAHLAGVPKATMSRLLYGCPCDNQPPSSKIRPETAAKLLSVRPSAGLLADDSRVDATGVRRRLQALAAVGWPGVTLSARMGWKETYVSELQRRDGVVYVRTDRDVRVLYEDLCDQDPVEDGVKPTAALRARLNAERRGWLPPHMWDTDIDDPAAGPDQPDSGALDDEAVLRALDGKPVTLTRDEQMHAAQLMTERGDSARDISGRLGVTERTVTRWRSAGGWAVTC